MNPRKAKEWNELNKLSEAWQDISLLGLFDKDKSRVEKFTLEAGPLLADLSRHAWDTSIQEKLTELLKTIGFEKACQDLFGGELFNFTEKRAVLHSALRNPKSAPKFNGEDLEPIIEAELKKLEKLVTDIQSEKWLGHTGKPIRSVVNIGIGGSDLGPKMIVRALEPWERKTNIKAYFVSNVDGAHLDETLSKVDLEETLFVVASKTFTTLETMTNAFAARDFLIEKLGDSTAVAKHFVALSTNEEAVLAFGIDKNHVLGFWDWVGGRYSLWSVIGFSIALSCGLEAFRELRLGAAEMDGHFKTAPLEKNLPVQMAILGIWEHNFLGYESLAILPYSERMEYFPGFLKQLDMESNGKGSDKQGNDVDYQTGPVVWGAPGTNGQHAFFQLLHQGTSKVSADFILPVQAHHDFKEHNIHLVANCLAQTEALMKGKSRDVVEVELRSQGMSEEDIEMLAPHKVFKGNKPTTTIFTKELNPRSLGALVALYEHKIFVQGVVWNINSFDQYGVELGKVLEREISDELHDLKKGEHDSSIQANLDLCKKWLAE